MIVVDTSVWIEFLRATGSRAHLRLRALIEADAEIATTEIIVMELLAGATAEREARAMRSRLLAFPILPLHGLTGFEAAAELYRECRRSGEMLRTLADCLIAVPVIAADAALLHVDRDFDAIARHSPLRIEPLA